MNEERTETWVYIGESVASNDKLSNTWLDANGEQHLVNFGCKTAIGNIYSVVVIKYEDGHTGYRLGNYVKRSEVIEPKWLLDHQIATGEYERHALEKRLAKERSAV